MRASTTKKRALKRIGLGGGVTARASRCSASRRGGTAERQAGFLVQFARGGDAQAVRQSLVGILAQQMLGLRDSGVAQRRRDRRDPPRRRETPGGSA